MLEPDLILTVFIFHVIFQFENEIQGIQSDVSDLNKQQVRIIYILFCWSFLGKP